VVVVNLNRLVVRNAHLSDLCAINGKVGVPFEVIQEFGEFDLDILESFIFSNPLR